jgi:hypothetical protein
MNIFKKCKLNFRFKPIYRNYHDSLIDPNFKLYLTRFYSMKDKRINTTLDLIHSKEYILGNYFLYINKYQEASEVFEDMKSHLRSDYIASHIYCVILRRLGLSRLRISDFKEGLLEFDNIFEYSKQNNELEKDLQMSTTIELMKIYLLYNSKKANYIVNNFNKGESYNDSVYLYYKTVIELFI